MFILRPLWVSRKESSVTEPSWAEGASWTHFLRGQSRIGQVSQFSSSSRSKPKGIFSPHWQSQPSVTRVLRSCSQIGQVSTETTSMLMVLRTPDGRYDVYHS